MLDVAGLCLTENERSLLKQAYVGGLILFARNYRSKAQLIDLIADIRGQNPHIVIAVEQEGGRVQRFREEFIRLPAMQSLHIAYQKNPEKALRQATALGWLMATEIVAMDIDISFAPVLDLHWSHSDVIGTRSLGKDHRQVSSLAMHFITGMREAGMRSTGKHFPGHGWATADSHLEIAIDERELVEIERDDLQPFKMLINSGLDALMPAHVIYSKVDSRPAGFSKYWLQDVLRYQLEFDGVIFSDDLNMDGANLFKNGVQQPFSSRAAAALEAGCDTVLVCNNPQAAESVLHYLEAEKIPMSTRLGRMRLTKKSVDLQRFDNAQKIAAELLTLCE
jgi:beta-N-acetylhexosaminidase